MDTSISSPHPRVVIGAFKLTVPQRGGKRTWPTPSILTQLCLLLYLPRYLLYPVFAYRDFLHPLTHSSG